MDLSILIINFNTKDLFLDCIQSIKKNTKGIDYEIIAIDNASTDSSQNTIRKLAQKFKNLRVVENKKNLGFAKANNQGLRSSKGRYILLLNSDTKLLENSLSKMVAWMDKNKKVGIASCKLVNSDGGIQATGGFFPSLFRLFLWAFFLDDLPFIHKFVGSYHPHTPKLASDFYQRQRPLDWVTGAFFLIRREVVEKVGNFDENFFMYVEEIDYCFRAKKLGWYVFYTPLTKIIHIGGASDIGSGVKLADTGVSKEGSVLGEFTGLKRFYHKYYPKWNYPFLVVLLKLAAFARVLVFGILGRQAQAIKIYGKALATS